MTLVSLGTGAVHISPRAIFAAMLWHTPLSRNAAAHPVSTAPAEGVGFGPGGRGAWLWPVFSSRGSFAILSPTHTSSDLREEQLLAPASGYHFLFPVVGPRFQRHRPAGLRRLGGDHGPGVFARSIGRQDQRGDPSAGRFRHQHHLHQFKLLLRALRSHRQRHRKPGSRFPGCMVSSAFQAWTALSVSGSVCSSSASWLRSL